MGTRGVVRAHVDVFRRIAQATCNDRRGWSLGGSLRFREVSSGGAFTLWLAAPSSLPGFSPVCSAEYSCRVGRHVAINDERWREGTTAWPAVREHQQYVLNHELGRWLGSGHRSCSGPGAAAPRRQQSISLQGCVASTWPVLDERQAAARQQRVAVRTTRPDLYAVAQHGDTGTEVHVLNGAADYRSWQAHLATPCTRPPPGLDADTGDHDRDGVADVYAVNRRGGWVTEVHVLDGSSRFQRWTMHRVTPLHLTGERWDFAVEDVDGNGWTDVLAIARSGGSNSTELHVLGDRGHDRFVTHAATALHATADAPHRRFAAG